MRWNIFLQLLKSCKEAGLVADLGSSIVVRMATGPVRKNHYARLEAADHTR